MARTPIEVGNTVLVVAAPRALDGRGLLGADVVSLPLADDGTGRPVGGTALVPAVAVSVTSGEAIGKVGDAGETVGVVGAVGATLGVVGSAGATLDVVGSAGVGVGSACVVVVALGSFTGVVAELPSGETLLV